MQRISMINLIQPPHVTVRKMSSKLPPRASWQHLDLADNYMYMWVTVRVGTPAPVGDSRFVIEHRACPSISS